jgi:hypothetical protein
MTQFQRLLCFIYCVFFLSNAWIISDVSRGKRFVENHDKRQGGLILGSSHKEDLPFNKANHIDSVFNRLKFIPKKLLSTISILALASSMPSATFPAVGEGDLPVGASLHSPSKRKGELNPLETSTLEAKHAFQNDFTKVKQTLEQRSKDLTIEEQVGLQFFFKRFANEEIDDMNFLSKGILDPQMKKEATEVAKTVRKCMLV